MIPYQLHYQPDAGQWLEFRDPVASIRADEPEQVLPALAELQRRVDDEGLNAAGWVGYSAARGPGQGSLSQTGNDSPLLCFSLYHDLKRIDDLPENLPALQSAVGRAEQTDQLTLGGFDSRVHAVAVNKIKAYLQNGDTYQVNYTQLLRGHWPSGSDVLFRRMVAAQPQSYAAYLVENERAICSVSPELFFTLNGDQILSKPMKGTARRGRSSQEDVAAAEALRASVKDQAENLMIVDMVRNDLGRIARTGTVHVDQLFELERYPTVWQLTSTISAQTNATVAQIFAALFPCASIVGAPKLRTMEIIDELEREPRGLYTGAIGWLLPGRQAQFNVAIRTAVVNREGELSYGVGGGIVWDSDPKKEAQECLDKAQVLAEPVPRDFKLLETLRWSPAEGYWLLDEHLQRLAASADYFDYPFQRAEAQQQLGVATEQFLAASMRVRLTLADDGEFEITHQPLLASTDPVRVALYSRPLASDETLRFHKTDPRPWLKGVPTPAEAGVDDWLFTNLQGELTESTIANLVVKYQGRWLTPPLAAGLLSGTYRQRLLDTGVIHEQTISVNLLRSCSYIGLINSVRGWRSAILVAVNSH